MKRVLIVAPAWVGDMVMAQALFKRLKRQSVEHLAIMAPSWTVALAERMPEVGECVVADFAHGQLALGQRYQLGKSLRDQFDTAIVLPNSLKSALIPAFARIPRRIGYLGEYRYWLINDCRLLNKKRLPRTVERFINLGGDISMELPPIDNPQLTVDVDNQADLMRRFGLSKPIVALCPGAEYGPSKQWPLDYFAELGGRAVNEGYQVIALGSKKDSALIATIQKQVSDVINLAGQTRITDAIDLLAKSACVVTNDSGLMHIAAAVNVPVYAIYGSTTPEMTPPLSEQAKIFQRDDLGCRPCFRRQCPLKGDANMACLNEIRPNDVWGKIKKGV